MNLTRTQLEAFDRFWTALHADRRRLDGLLASQSPNVKSWLAEIAPLILLRPVSLAEALGIGVQPGEPWSIPPEKRGEWKVARLLADRLADSDRPRLIRDSEPLEEDFPPELIQEWKQAWGEKTTAELVRELGSPAPRSLRFRTVDERDAFHAAYAEQLPFPLKLSAISPLGVRAEGYLEITRAPEYEEGQIEIQDEGSQRMSFFALYPELFSPGLQERPGAVSESAPAAPSKWPDLDSRSRLVDACAGAGGKSLAWAAIGRNRGRIFAYDVADKKLQALRRRAKRAGWTNIQVLALPEGQERDKLASFDSSADRVLVDAPCSGWGVLRRNPDTKWGDMGEPLLRLENLQARLLAAYAPLVRPGGILTFGVCTFRKEETTDQVVRFLSEHSEFSPIAGGYLGPGPTDGFFMQAFRRKP